MLVSKLSGEDSEAVVNLQLCKTPWGDKSSTRNEPSPPTGVITHDTCLVRLLKYCVEDIAK